jgi:YHS domain-containing protein
MSHEGHEHEGGGQMGGMTHEEPASSDNSDALAKLSPADRELAEKQKICPVSGEPLGAMGTPYKVTVEGQDVMLCCSGCEAKIKANPKEYLAKLKQ